MIRVLILLPLLAGLGWWLDRQQESGRFQQVDELFLDFLVGNARDRFDKAAILEAEASPVVWVRMRASDRAEYAGWPPRPLDWQMVFKGLQPYEPAVIVVPETLLWGRPSPEFVREAATALIPFPSTVLGMEARLAETAGAPAFLGGLQDALPRFQKVRGDSTSVPSLGALIAAPDDQMRRQSDIAPAISRSSGEQTTLPYALQEGDNLRPSLFAQALAHASGTPYATHRLVVGAGAGAYLADGGFVPLTESAEFAVNTQTTVLEVDALNLMTVELAEALTPQDKQHLGHGKVVVIGTDDDSTGSLARVHAQALARALSMPRIHLLPSWAEWIVWAAAGLTGCALVGFVPKRKALVRGGLLIFLGLVICFVAFQSRLIWCPPTLPVALLLAATLFGRMAGKTAEARMRTEETMPEGQSSTGK